MLHHRTRHSTPCLLFHPNPLMTTFIYRLSKVTLIVMSPGLRPEAVSQAKSGQRDGFGLAQRSGKPEPGRQAALSQGTQGPPSQFASPALSKFWGHRDVKERLKMVESGPLLAPIGAFNLLIFDASGAPFLSMGNISYGGKQKWKSW